MLAHRSALIRGLVVLAVVILGPGAASAVAGSLPLGVRVAAHRQGSANAHVALTAVTSPGARCDGTVAVAHIVGRLPPLITSGGLARWSWGVPAGAPRSPWRFSVTCHRGARRAHRRKSAHVRTGRLRGAHAHPGLMIPNSLTISIGRSATRPTRSTSTGGRGAGVVNPGDSGYCTWGAWNLAQWLGSSVSGDAKYWYPTARNNGLPTGTTPVVGAVFVLDEGQFGHVGVVTKVDSATTYETMEMNGGNQWTDKANGKTNEFGRYVPHTRVVDSHTHFIYKPGTQPGAYIGHIVQWSGDQKSQKTAWMVGPDGKRRWIPTIGIYNCLKGHGVPGPDVLDPSVLDQYSDLTGQWETCSSSGYGAGVGAAPADPDAGGRTDVPPDQEGAVTYPQPVVGVQNTSEQPPDGVYFRNSPHTADTSRINGLGVYSGERVELLCYGWGDAVGAYDDALWYEVANVSRPNVNGIANSGWLNAHYVADGLAANQPDAGVAPCSGYSATPPGSGPTQPPTQTPTQPSTPPTWSETAGGVAHTWTNYTNAGGTQGPSIASNQTVQISCKLAGFRVSDGNTWWYRIASSPWNNAYYVSADAFYNNGQTSGSLAGTPWVDGNVANC